jgi:hypothetical protein
VLAQWGVPPCDLAILAKQTTAAQEAIMAAFAEHAAKPRKADLMEPTLPPVPAGLATSHGDLDSDRKHLHTLGLTGSHPRLDRS